MMSLSSVYILQGQQVPSETTLEGSTSTTAKQNFLSVMIAKDAHQRVAHNGIKEATIEVRSRFWIPRCRQFIRRILNNCFICRWYQGKPYSAPPLPEFRVSEMPPFTFVGLDYAGPLYIRNETTEPKKVWICLLTCCVVRGVHLEIVVDLTAQAFIRAFKRFVARRVFPSNLVSDNSKTFKSATLTHGMPCTGVEKDWKQFIQNRVSEVRKLVPPAHWNHCPGKDNPTDLPSQGVTTVLRIVQFKEKRY